MKKELEKKQTILIVHNHYKIPGGEDTVVQNEKRLLEENGHRVILYTKNNANIRMVDYFSTFFSFKVFFEIRSIIEREKIDIVHVHNTLNLITPAVYYAAVSMNKPVFQTMHNYRLLCPGALFIRDGKICEECLSKGIFNSCKYGCYRNSKIQTFISALNTFIHKKTGIFNKVKFIALSDFNKKKLEQKYNSKIYVKPNFTYEPKQYEELKIPFDDYYIFVGRIETEKGIEVLVKAFENNNKKLIIVGNGNKSNQLRNTIKRRNLNNIFIMGYLDRDRLNTVTKKAKALIVPSQWYETFGMTIIEAYSLKVPVIVGNIGNIELLVNDRETGVKFKYDSVKALRKKLEEFEALDRHVLAENAYKEFVYKYSPEVNYKRLIEIYNEK